MEVFNGLAVTKLRFGRYLDRLEWRNGQGKIALWRCKASRTLQGDGGTDVAVL